MVSAPWSTKAAKQEAAPQKIPTHIAIIMDGNGRWARKRGLPRLAGHRAGTDNIKRIIEAAVEHGVKMLTLYAFSTENWNRPSEEVSGLMSLLSQVIDRETENLNRNGARLQHVGSAAGLDEQLQKRIRWAVDRTKNNDRIVVNVALNYGGRAEIVEALRRIVQEGVSPDEITEDLVTAHLYTAGAPDPDLVIRTGGEMRLSNFLLWQAAYAEYWSTPVFWPDFGKDEFHEAILEYGRRQRRFGALG